MGDTTGLTVTVYNVPAEQARNVLGSLREMAGDSLHCFTDPLGDTVELGNPFGAEVRAGYGDDLSSALVDDAPGATWEMVEDAHHEFPALVWMYTPTLGLFYAEGVTDGGERFTANEFHEWITEWAEAGGHGDDDPPESLHALVRGKTGELHRAAMRTPDGVTEVRPLPDDEDEGDE